MFFSLELYQKLNLCIYLCKYIPTLFNNIHEYHVQKEELWHMSPRKKNQYRIPIKHLFLMQQKLPFLSVFFPKFPRAHDLQKHFIIQLCQERAIHLTRKNASLRRIVTTAWSNVEQWPAVERTGTASSNGFFFGRSTMVLTLCDSKDT